MNISSSFRSIVMLCFALALSVSHVYAQKSMTLSGVMRHSNLEDGCWYLESKDGKYELSGSPEALAAIHVENRPVVLRVHSGGMMGSVCMIGKMYIIEEVLDTLPHPHDPPVEKKKITGVVHRTKKGCWYVLASDKHRYEMRNPVPIQFAKIGRRYDRLSKVIPASESECTGMFGVIVFGLDPDLRDSIPQRRSSPR